MIRSQLNSYSGGDPIWGFVALIGTERFSGEAAVGIDPRVRLFAVDGQIYFAERDGDAPVGTRLVNCGAISAAQLEHGAVQLGDTTSLSRLFQREPSIDRDAVELTIEFATESLLASIANKPVGMPEVFPLRHHSTGIHHWLRAAAPHSAAPSSPAGSPEPAVTAEPEAVVAEAVVAEAAEAVAAPVAVVEESVAVVEEPVAALVAEPAAVPVFEAPVAEPIVEPVFELPPLALAPVLAPIVDEPVAEPEVAEPAAEVDTPITQPAAEPSADGYADSPWTEQARSSWEPDPAVYVAEPFAAEPASKPAATEALPTLTPWAAIPASHPATPEPADDPFAALDSALLAGGADAGLPAPAKDVTVEDVTVEDVTVEDVTVDETSIAVQPVAEAPAPSPTLSLLALPTLNGSNGSNGHNGHNGHAHESLTPPTAAGADEITATLPVIPAEETPSQPFATLGGLTPLTPLTAPDVPPAPELAPAAPVAGSPADDLFDSLPEQPSYEPGPAPEGLPKLASAPISMTDLKAANAEAAVAPFGGPTHNLAAVDIWEMVDVLMDDGQPADQDLVNSGGSEKRSRGWLRGRKG